MRLVAMLVMLAGFGPAAWAGELACIEEYGKFKECSARMAVPGLSAEEAQKVSDELDAALPKYQACMDEYERVNGTQARAELDSKLAAS